MAESRRPTYSKKFGDKHWKNDKFKQNPNHQSRKERIKAFQEKQKRMVLKQYKQTLKEEKKQLQSQVSDADPKSKSDGIERLNKKIKMSSYQRAQEVFKRKQDEILERKEEKARIQKEKDEARKKYRQNKMRKMNVLRQKTRKGQPLMKGRIELLLEKIEKQAKH